MGVFYFRVQFIICLNKLALCLIRRCWSILVTMDNCDRFVFCSFTRGSDFISW